VERAMPHKVFSVLSANHGFDILAAVCRLLINGPWVAPPVVGVGVFFYRESPLRGGLNGGVTSGFAWGIGHFCWRYGGL